MSQIVLGADKQVAEWVWSRMRVPSRRPDGEYVGIGIAEEGKLVIGAIYYGFRKMPFGTEIAIGLAIENPRYVTRGNIAALLRYPFVQLKCTRLVSYTGRKNKRMRKFLEGMGSHLEGVHRHAYDGRQDAISYAMFPQDAERWIGRRGARKPVERAEIEAGATAH